MNANQSAEATASEGETTPGTATMLPKSVKGEMKILILNPKLVREEEGFNDRGDLGDMDAFIESVRAAGRPEGKKGKILTPIHVRRKDGEYFVQQGHRRLLAAKKLGLDEIPAIRVKTKNEVERHILALLGNDQKPLAPVEEALAFKRLREEFKVGVKEIAKASGRSVLTVKARLKLAEGDPEVLDAVAKGKVAAAMGTAIVKKTKGDKKKQKKLVRKAKKSKAGKRAVAEEVGHNKKWNAQQRAGAHYEKTFAREVKSYNSKKENVVKLPTKIALALKKFRKAGNRSQARIGFLVGVWAGALGKV